jgi:hypothetical protein
MYPLVIIIGGVCVFTMIKCVKMRMNIRRNCSTIEPDLEAPLVDLTDYSSI